MFKKRIQEYIDTVCHDGIYVHSICVSNPIDENAILNAYRLRIYPFVFNPYIGNKGYTIISASGNYYTPSYVPTTLDEIVQDIESAYPSSSRNQTSINDVIGYNELLHYFVENIDNILSLRNCSIDFEVTYNSAIIRISDINKHITTTITPSLYHEPFYRDFLNTYDQHIYKLINDNYISDIESF